MKVQYDKEELFKSLEIPKSARPGWDYYWDYDDHKWVQVKDDDDMSWWADREMCQKIDKKKVRPEKERLTGKQWKEIFVSPMKDMPISASHIIL